MLVKLRNPLLAKIVGGVAAFAFLFAVVGYRNMLRFVLPALGVFILFFLVRRYILNRRRKLTPIEEEYLEKRFYKH